MSSKRQRSFAEITWEDLEDWAGSRVVGRGRGYKSCVSDLRSTTDGALLAWVQGTDQYATQIGFDAQGQLFSHCTCPYGVACKHAEVLADLTDQVALKDGNTAKLVKAVRREIDSLVGTGSSRDGMLPGTGGRHARIRPSPRGGTLVSSRLCKHDFFAARHCLEPGRATAKPRGKGR
ncbi:MAG: SWIM zinc finger family protein [Verrucomicrobia bacterium]|nr:SWIM zinc finger family protein [Verrucomicrobiota bacterium]